MPIGAVGFVAGTVTGGESGSEKIPKSREFSDDFPGQDTSDQRRLRYRMNLIQVARASGVSRQLSETFIQCTVKHQIRIGGFAPSLISKGRPFSK